MVPPRDRQPYLRWPLLAAALAVSTIAALPAAETKPAAKQPAPFKHGEWPFRPAVKPDVPVVKNKEWVANEIDAFILAKLEEKEIVPNRPADKVTLLRRVTFDLTGLPPTPTEQDAFLADESADAFAKVVDRLLASPHYGERWAQHWLDVVRYAESDGFKQDAHRPFAYGYRDYVIRAFNADLPYDRFIRQQIAGDELEPDNPDALVATGLNRLHTDEYNAPNLKQRRQEILDDITDTTGLAFMGLTMGCAQCHDHKFDAILQTDYFRLQAFYANVLPRDDQFFGTPEQVKKFQAGQAAWEDATKELRAQIDKLVGLEKGEPPDLSKYDEESQEAIRTPDEKRTTYQRQLAHLAAKNIEAKAKPVPADKKADYEALLKKLAEFDHLKPEPVPNIMAVHDAGAAPPATYLLAGGNFKNPKEEVQPGFPVFLTGTQPDIKPQASCPGTTGRRTALAEWLARGDHPLTARVMVNRLWQHHFGLGIVSTPNDFGAMGDPPSHLELLDWLAMTFVEKGWSLKAMHRLMLLSNTYQQSSLVKSDDANHAKAIEADPSDRLLWHARRKRLEGEAIRDAVLCSAGDLNLRMYGPSARPELPAQLVTNYAWTPDTKVEDRDRRSIYVQAKRNLRFPLFDAFDWPDLHNSCARRTTTITAPQSLMLLNSEFTLTESRRYAESLLANHPSELKNLIGAAYRETFGRAAADEEVSAAVKFIEKQEQVITKSPPKTSPEQPSLPDMEAARFGAIVDFCHALLNSNEFLYLD